MWWGGINGLASSQRRYYYITRKEAQHGDISDSIGQHGRIE